MKYYLWGYDSRYLSHDQYVRYKMSEREPELKKEFEMSMLDGKSHQYFPSLEDWLPYRLVPDDTPKNLATKMLGDFCGIRIVSSRVREHLGDILERYGVLYPITLMNFEDENREFFVYACSNILDCTDKERSVFAPTGSILQRFLDHSKLVHEPEIFVNDRILYVSEVFKERVAKVKPKLTGFELREEGIHINDHDYKPWRSTPTVVKRQPKPIRLASVEDFQSYEREKAEGLGNYIIGQVQNAVDLNQGTELEQVLFECLKAHTNEQELARIIACHTCLSKFDEEFKLALEAAIKLAKKDKEIKALYCEYYYDGSDASIANIFLCDQTENDAVDWASSFTEVLGNIPIAEYFNYLKDDKELSNLGEKYAQHYIAVGMLNIILKHYRNLNPKYPLGFGNHDWDLFPILTKVKC